MDFDRILSLAFRSARQLLCCATLLLITMAVPLVGQSTFGSFVGTVKDASGAVIPDCVVTLTNTGTSAQRSSLTDKDGGYVLVNIEPGEFVSLVGPSGCGKTTLLRVLLGQLPPQKGSVKLGTNLQIAYFDQLRGQLGDDKTVEQDVGDGYDTVKINGQSRHIIGYLRDFLFTPERARTPVRFLSGGERNRVHLAKLLRRGSNVLLLDEPTNDLDVDTLRALEEAILNYVGCVVVITHDRWFLDRIATHILACEGDSQWVFFDGNYQEYEADKKKRLGEEGAKPHRVRFKALK